MWLSKAKKEQFDYTQNKLNKQVDDFMEPQLKDFSAHIQSTKLEIYNALKKRELKFLVKKEKTITRQMQKLADNLPKLPQEEEETPDDTIEYTFENFFDRLNDSEKRKA